MLSIKDAYTSKPFASSTDVVRELEKKIPGYRKNTCNFEVLYPKTKEAISNCEKLDMYHAGNNATGEFANPRTDIYTTNSGRWIDYYPRGKKRR